MAKRISMDAIIVLRNAGYTVTEVFGKRNKRIAIDVWGFERAEQLPIAESCIENEAIENLIKWTNYYK